jgi:hypothetical protein
MLLQLLSATFRFITVRDLKSTPLSVIKRLRQIPEKYLKALASKKLQGILEVRLFQFSSLLISLKGNSNHSSKTSLES